MPPLWLRLAMRGTEKPDYDRIAQLEYELGYRDIQIAIEPPPTTVKRIEVLTSTDPDRPVLKMIFEGRSK